MRDDRADASFKPEIKWASGVEREVLVFMIFLFS